MLYQKTTLPLTRSGASILNQKMLLLNGYPAIEYQAYDAYKQGSIFSEENVLLIVTEGMLNFRYGTLKYTVGKDQMIFLKNNIMVDYQTIRQPDGPAKVEFIKFSLGYELIKEFTRLTQLSSTIRSETSGIITTILDSNLHTYLESLLPYLHSTSKVDGSLIRIKLLELLFCLAGCDTRMLDLLLDLRKNFRPNITTIVEDNLMTSLSIHELAVLSGRSLSSFRRDFVSIYNMPPSQWIRERRLKKAKELLLTTKMTVTDICYTLGFENIAHFSRLFKSQFRYSPSEYRLGLMAV